MSVAAVLEFARLAAARPPTVSCLADFLDLRPLLRMGCRQAGQALKDQEQAFHPFSFDNPLRPRTDSGAPLAASQSGSKRVHIAVNGGSVSCKPPTPTPSPPHTRTTCKQLGVYTPSLDRRP